MKIKCPLCNFENEEDARFCSNCNEPLFSVKDSEIRRESPYTKKENKKYDDNLSLDIRNKKVRLLYYTGSIIFICFVVYFLGPKLGLFLTPSYTTLRTTKAPGVRINIDNPNYPLKFISDGYKFTKITEGEGTKYVEWVWQYTVLNNSNKAHKVSVNFKLIDIDSFVISYSQENTWVSPYSEVTIRGKSSFSFYDLKRVYGRTWSIDYSSYYGEFILPGFPGGLGPKTF